MKIAEIIEKNVDIPAVPMVAVKIRKLVDDPNADVNAVQEAIMADQALAARVLGIANSVYYGTGRRVDTISAAIMITGFGAIKNLALAVSTRSVYKKFGLLEQKLWEHSIGASIAAGIIARQVRFSDPEEATIAGLLHDIGKVVMNNSYPERFLMLTETVYNDRVPFEQREQEVFGYGHAAVGGVFAGKWRFSEALCSAISLHHSHDGQGRFPGDDYHSALCAITALSDALCIRLGVGYRGPMKDLPLMDGSWKKILGISDEQYDEIVETFKGAYIREKMAYQE
ncbi:MAG: HDOD domain-containing protein [Nitrospiraceae bacterium]|nr:HDOD domain-containing protein [Nitrospiraceae bacterium]